MTLLRPRPAGWCLLAALSLHAVVGAGLHWQAQALAATGGAHAAAGPRGPQPLQLRWVTAATPSPADARPVLAEPRRAATQESPGTDDAPNRVVDAGPDAAIAAAHTTAADANALDGLPGYARRDLLDRGPQALSIIQIAYPQGVEPGHVHTGRLTLFIDETGTVRKVLVQGAEHSDDDTEALPPPFVEAARAAFMQAQFAPGERHGMAVKSRIDIEVSFDGREADPIEAARQARDSGPAERTTDRPV